MKFVIDLQTFELEIEGFTIQDIYNYLLEEQLIIADSQFICNGKILKMSDPIPNYSDTLFINTKKQAVVHRNKDNMMEMMDSMQPLVRNMDKDTFKQFMKSSQKDLTNEQLNGMYDLLKKNSIKQLMQSSDMQMARLDAQGYLGQVIPHMGLDEIDQPRPARANLTNPQINKIERDNCVQGELNKAPMPNPFQLHRNKKR
eukprot:NODE_714_length_4847_cov_0.370893.p3 type:complete len:200 gc:universal NODE_714_length_4847_cov_0.370893:4309-3710(-)